MTGHDTARVRWGQPELSGSTAVVLAVVRDHADADRGGAERFLGFWAIAGSAQFSALVTEADDPVLALVAFRRTAVVQREAG
ncbi:hypothetical protein [Amycolatopsis silviterrae]|uniref:Antibiotic biosynthesis monooxygenase n=1 Tax=Amycolatopsis silviterrae TaxID=1656914 RepID=A0ABW5H405_9PSEU